MRIRNTTALPLVAISLACASASSPSLSRDEAKTTYAIGYEISKQLEPLALEPDELDAVLQGLRDGIEGRDPRIDVSSWSAKTPDLIAARQKLRAAPEEEASQAWLSDVARDSGATKTESGLLFLETRAGEGAAPTTSDEIAVHYTGRLRDGSVFDDSREGASPATLPLAAAIPCWQEALQKMKPGGAASIWCPSALAYGYRGSGPIPPGAALHFEVELIGIVAP